MKMIPLIELRADAEGIFRKRINKFLGVVEIGHPYNETHQVHIHDPGRLNGIIEKGRKVLLKKAEGKNRKTAWDIIAGWNRYWIPVHSGYHRRISEEILGNEKASPFGKVDEIKAEVRYGDSRLDFMIVKKGIKTWVEVKGCTLERNGIALFPDAPTKRGRKHIETLMDLKKKGYGAAIIFLVFRREAKCLLPNEEADRGFAETFHDAMDAGVSIHAPRLIYEKGIVYFDGEIKVCSGESGL